MRACIFVLVFAGMAAHVPGNPRAAGVPGTFLWSVSGPERFAASREIPLDPAARLAAEGAYGNAFKSLDGGSDSLRAGILACYADRYGDAAALLARPTGNRYLEWLRRYYRALALRETDRPREAFVELDSFFVLTDELAVEPDGNVGAAARDLRVGVISRDDSLWNARGDLLELGGGGDARAMIVVAKAYIDRGLDTLAAGVFLRGSGSRVPTSLSELLWEVVGRVRPFLPEASSRELRALASRALAEGRREEAQRLIELLEDMDDTDEATGVLAARLRLAAGDRAKALDAFRSIASSGSTASARAEAARRAADLELRSGEPDSASARYEALGEETGDPTFIDQAARIELRLGRFDRALALWERHDAAQERNLGTARAARPAFAALDRAALLHRLGRDGEAHGILRDTPEIGQREEEGRLYWLSMTSPGDSERAARAARLAETYPASLYAGALEGGFDSLARQSGPDDRAARLDRLVGAEWDLVDSLQSALPPEGWFDRHPARQAYRWALDRGLVSEAAEFSIALERTGVAKAPEALALYRDARERGFCDFAIWLLNRPFADNVPLRARLRHPVAFASILSNDDLAAGLSPELLLAVMYAESKFARTAASPSGAIGVMQLMPSTARWFARTRGWSDGYCRDLHDPACNIRVGAHYLEYLLDRANGSLVGALAAYNAGERRMAEWRKRFDPAGDPMVALELISPAETAEYVKRVLETLRYYRLLADGRREAL